MQDETRPKEYPIISYHVLQKLPYEEGKGLRKLSWAEQPLRYEPISYYAVGPPPPHIQFNETNLPRHLAIHIDIMTELRARLEQLHTAEERFWMWPYNWTPAGNWKESPHLTRSDWLTYGNILRSKQSANNGRPSWLQSAPDEKAQDKPVNHYGLPSPDFSFLRDENGEPLPKRPRFTGPDPIRQQRIKDLFKPGRDAMNALRQQVAEKNTAYEALQNELRGKDTAHEAAMEALQKQLKDKDTAHRAAMEALQKQVAEKNTVHKTNPEAM
jgi:LmbE family N-acetylglucosaminyl deacetylase